MFKACEVGIAFNCMFMFDTKINNFCIAFPKRFTFVKDELNGHPTL